MSEAISEQVIDDTGAVAKRPIDAEMAIKLAPAMVLVVGIMFTFWNMIKYLPTLWGSDDGYYSHGYLVPFISGYVVYRNWDKIKDRAIKPQYWAGVLILGVMYMAYLASVTQMLFLSSLTFLACLLVSTLFLAGWGWLGALFFPIMYLGFALPMFSMAIENYTNPLQLISTKVSYALLQAFGLGPYMADPSTVMLNNFTLNVAVPCSGLKLLLALAAFTTFFILVANLKWWANAVMVLMWIPLALFINGLRIALIGVVGNAYGHEAGMQFHDYSGYITLIVCFFILFSFARGLGWKN